MPKPKGMSQDNGSRWYEHPKTTCRGGIYTERGASEDAKEVILVANTRRPNGKENFKSLDRENLGFEKRGHQKKTASLLEKKRTLKHCVMNIERFTRHQA
jgi:hypothetical protein